MIPALQLLCNNVPDKTVHSQHRYQQSEPFQWESYKLKFSPRFLVLCLTHILIGIFLQEKNKSVFVFFSSLTKSSVQLQRLLNKQ